MKNNIAHFASPVKQNIALFMCYSTRARPLRLEFPGAVYHVTSRGNFNQNIFLNEKDRKLFVELPVVARSNGFAKLTWDREGEGRKQKDEIIYRAYVDHGYRMGEIAAYLGALYTTISRAIRRMETFPTGSVRI